jgi:hypothetical protein
MWRDGGRAGLQTDDRLPVEQIVSLGQSQALQLTASNAAVDRRKKPRPAVDSRLRGRAMQFASVVVIGASLALAIWSMASEAFAKPMAAVAAVLG